jgi:hypothetical protein
MGARDPSRPCPFLEQRASAAQTRRGDNEEGVNLSHDGSSPEGGLDLEWKERRVKLKDSGWRTKW